jgi:tetratricopeptide (TPR) repeat protein
MMCKCNSKVFLTLIFPVVLSACSTLQISDDNSSVSDNAGDDSGVAEPTALIDHKGKALPDKGLNHPDINLDGDMLFNLLAAEFAGNAGDIDASLKYYNQASKSIEDGRIAQRTAYIALYGKKYAEALTALDRWRELDPDSSDLSRMYAVTYLKLEQPEKAVSHIEMILARSPGSSAEKAVAVKNLLAKEASIKDAYVVLQKLNATGQKASDAQGNIQRQNVQRQKNQHLLILQSRYAAQLQHYDEALLLLDEVLEIDPSLHDVLVIKARILSTQGKQVEAAELIQQVVTKFPDNLVLRKQYARILVEQRRLQSAVTEYEILYKKSPADSDVAISLALLYIETKQLDKATETLKQLIVSDKKVDVANYYLGRIAQNKGDDKQAISYYLKVLKGDYKFDAQMRTGILLADLGKPNDALAKLEALAEAQTEWPLRVKAYLAQGEVLRNQRRYKEAVEMYSRALQQNRDDTTLLYARGLMAEKVDRLDMTEADLLKVISKEPENANALNALGYTLADRTVRYQEALAYIKRAAALVPDDPAILDSLGWVSFRLGNIEDALKWLSKAFQKLEDAEIAAHYGEVLWHNSQKQKAREVWKIGKDQNADNPVLVETLKRIQP